MSAAEKPKSAPKLKLKAPPDFQARVMSRLNATAPKTKSDGTRPVAGYEVGRTSESILSEIKYVLRTGIRSYDDIAGGFPFGRVCEVYGLESCGKTAMVIRAAVKAQTKTICEVVRRPGGGVTYEPIDPARCDVCVLYIDNEQSIDDDGKLRVDGQNADFILTRVDTVDLLFKEVETVIDCAEELELENAAKGIDKIVFVLIVVDTLAATSCRQELEMEWGKEDYARHPAQISSGFRRLIRDINRQNVCMICTNQVRDNIKDAGMNAKRRLPSPQSSDYTTFGGKPLRFYASHRTFMHKVSGRYKLNPDDRFPAGISISFVTDKNRLRPPMREGRMVLLFGENGGFSDEFSMLETLINYHFAEITNKEKQTDIVFKFGSSGVQPTTFGALGTSLSEDDELPAARRGRRKDPAIHTRAEWPDFYRDHKADFDKLWEMALQYAFTPSGAVPEISDSEPNE